MTHGPGEPTPRADDLVAAWDALAPGAVFSHPLDLPGWSARVLPGARVLDLGCGYGRATRELADAGYRVVGADSSPAMLARARVERPDLELVRLTPGPLPFADESFDAACLLAVLTCVPDPDDREGLAAELVRVLRPGGWLFVSDLLVQSDERNRLRYAAGFAKFGAPGTFELPDGPVLKHFETDELGELFDAFHPDEEAPFDVTTMRGNVAHAIRIWFRLRPGSVNSGRLRP